MFDSRFLSFPVPKVFRALVALLALGLCSAGAAPAAEAALEIGPVPGLTTAWHEAPAVSSVPVGVELGFRVAAEPGTRVHWLGAKAARGQEGYSVAYTRLDAAGPHLVRVSWIGPRGEKRQGSMLLHGEGLRPRLLGVEAREAEPAGESAFELAARSPVVGTGALAWRTSVDRPFTLAARVSPAGYAPLVEWRRPGERPALGSALRLSFAEAGLHTLEAGPAAAPAELEVETYRVRLESEWSGDPAEAALFRAATVPAGYEGELRWAAGVEGAGAPETGRGGTFAPGLAELEAEDGRMLVTVVVGPVGVAIVAIRPIFKGSCGQTSKLAVRDGAGRPTTDPPGTPNGFLFFGTTEVSTGGRACGPRLTVVDIGRVGDVWLPSLGEGLLRNGGSTTSTYTVTGNNLSQASNNIFDPNSGQGFQEPGGTDRYAGQAELSYEYEWSATDNGNGSVTVQIGDIDWSTEVKVPEWDGKDGASQGQQDEWDRFSEKLAEHEQGHVDINDTGMGNVKNKLSGKPAGKVVVEVSKIPEYDKEGNPKTPEDQAAHDAINDAVGNTIEGSQEFQDMESSHSDYDAPPSQSNPGGTDHGATQGATLDTSVQ